MRISGLNFSTEETKRGSRILKNVIAIQDRSNIKPTSAADCLILVSRVEAYQERDETRGSNRWIEAAPPSTTKPNKGPKLATWKLNLALSIEGYCRKNEAGHGIIASWCRTWGWPKRLSEPARESRLRWQSTTTIDRLRASIQTAHPWTQQGPSRVSLVCGEEQRDGGKVQDLLNGRRKGDLERARGQERVAAG